MKLHECCIMIVDCEHKTAPTQEDGYPSIRTPNIGRGHFILDGVNRVSEETYREWTRRAVPQAGDLIMAREAPVGNVAMVPEGLSPCLGQRTLLIRPDPEMVDPRFLTYLLIGPQVQSTIHSQTNGATVAHLNMRDVRNLELPALPGLAEQKHIAGILSAYDDLVENCERRIRVLDEMARSLYREWFVDFRLGDRWSSSPAGWETKSVKDVAEVQYGMPFKSALFTDDDTLGKALVRIRDVPAGQSFTFTPEPADPRYEIHEGDVLVGMDGDFHMTVWNGGPALLNQRVARFRSQGNWSPLHLFLLLQEPIRRLNRSIVGTTVAHLGDSHIREIKVLLPPEELLRAAFHSFEPLRLLSANLARRVRNLRATRDLLLPRLLSGQLSVDDAA